MTTRDPATGELTHKLSLNIHITGQALPLVVDADDWNAAAQWLRSAEFRRIASQVEFVTITNRET